MVMFGSAGQTQSALYDSTGTLEGVITPYLLLTSALVHGSLL